MRILLVHNSYGKHSGEETVVENIQRLLEEHGHSVPNFARSSADITAMPLGRTRAFISGVYSVASKKKMRNLLAAERPDVVHVHNLYPWISPSILPECRKAEVPVVMTLHNYRLVCPNGLHMVKGQVCERCRDGREYWCVLRNCEGSLPKSVGYALRNFTARRLGLFTENVTMYVSLTEFHKTRLIAEGVPEARISVVPNTVPLSLANGKWHNGDYVGFAGRISPEKGIRTFLSAARMHPDIPFEVAGDCWRMPELVGDSPSNCAFHGYFTGARLTQFFQEARLFVVPSIWFETFGLTAAEAMAASKPVIASDIGALQETVDDGVTGLLFEPGNADDLAEKIQYLWARPELCREMGQAGREKALREYSPQKYYERLMQVYNKAIELGPGGPKQ